MSAADFDYAGLTKKIQDLEAKVKTGKLTDAEVDMVSAGLSEIVQQGVEGIKWCKSKTTNNGYQMVFNETLKNVDKICATDLDSCEANWHEGKAYSKESAKVLHEAHETELGAWVDVLIHSKTCQLLFKDVKSKQGKARKKTIKSCYKELRELAYHTNFFSKC